MEGGVRQASRPWAAGLVHTITEEAVHQERPSVLVSTADGLAYVAVLRLGPCVCAWPLRAERLPDGEVVLTWVTGPHAALHDLFVSDPFRAI